MRGWAEGRVGGEGGRRGRVRKEVGGEERRRRRREGGGYKDGMRWGILVS